MTRLEKCELLKSKGYTYNPETGQVFGSRGNEIISTLKTGYIQLRTTIKPQQVLLAHHFAYFMTYGNVDFNVLDHINHNKTDNRISNLRNVTQQQNTFNNKAKGYCYDKRSGKYESYIKINYKKIYLGKFNTEQEAREAYLNAKKKYHNRCPL
jgi:hypothetical protein